MRYESGALAAGTRLLDRAPAVEGSKRSALLDAARIRAQVVALLEHRYKVHSGLHRSRSSEGVNRLGDYQWHADVSAARQTYYSFA